MKISTKQRKQSAKQFQQLFGADDFNFKIAQTIDWGKQSIDLINRQVGRMIVESIFLMDRENIAGPDMRLSMEFTNGRTNRAQCSLAIKKKKCQSHVCGAWVKRSLFQATKS